MSHLHTSKRTLITALAATFLLSACDTLTGGDDDSLVVDILDTQVQTPALVTSTFQVRTAAGEPVPNLSVNAFQILDNGQTDSELESEKAFRPKPGLFQTDVLLLLDLSGSITGSDALPALKTAAGAFIDNALSAEGVNVAVWWFDGSATISRLVDFTDDAAAAKAAVQAVTADIVRDNSTNLNGAIRLGLGQLESRLRSFEFRDVAQAGAMVVFTDGTDQANRVSAEAAIGDVERASSSISIYSIGLRGEIDENFLAQIGRSGSAFADDLESLLTEFAGIGNAIEATANSFYVLAYCSPRRSGSTNDLTIRVQSGSRTGEGSTTYSAIGFRGGCTV